MAYQKTDFKDTLRDAQGNVIQKGTPLNAEVLGKIEQGIVDTEQKIDTEIVKVNEQLAQTEQQVSTLETNKANKNEVNELANIKAEKVDLEATNLRIDNLIIPISPENANVEVTDAHVSLTKNKMFASLTKRFEEIEQTSASFIKNIVTNGNFKDGVFGWVGTTSSLTVVDNTLQMTANGSSINGVAYQDISGINLNHAIYTKLRVRVTNPDCNRIEIQYRGSTSGTTNKRPIVIDNPVENQWYEISGREIPNTVSGNLRLTLAHYYALPENALGKVMEAQQILVIDLTNTYGAGNEPTYLQMDSNLNEFGVTWFDGELPLKIFIELLEKKVASIEIPDIPEQDIFPITNKILNGDFADGTNNWARGYANGSITASNNELIYTIASPNSATRIVQTSFIPIINHKYYVAGNLYPQHASDAAISLGGVMTNFAALGGEWNRLRTVITAKTVDSFAFYNKTNNYSAGDYFKFKYILAIDLTESFGIGKEPTVEEMDALLSKYPNQWFDGEIPRIVGVKDLYEMQNKIKPSYLFADDLVGDYLTDQSEAFSNPENTQINEIYSKYNALMDAHPTYITKKLLGKNATGLDIYQYTFKPHVLSSTSRSVKLPKIIITSGTHGDEKSPVFSLYNAMKKIADSWKNDNILEFFRFNVEFIVIPIVNPYGFNNHLRYNSNGVDLNRNFPTGFNPAVNFSGSEAVSELETQLIINVFNENEDAEIMIDFHNMDFRDGFMSYALTKDSEVNEIMNRTINKMGRKWQTKYDFFPQAENHLFGYTGVEVNGSLAYHSSSYGMKDCLIEIVKRIEWQTTWSNFDELTIRCGEELLLNSLKSLFKLI